jgi:hypothetical protein
MIRINISNRQNLTLLAKAFLENLFVKCNIGEMFYDKDERNEIRFIYFEPNYYSLLTKDIFSSEKLSRITTSNSANEWKDLIEVIKNHEEIENIDYGKLFLYDIGNTNYSTTEIPQERIENVLSLPMPIINSEYDLYLSIEADLKRIYVGKIISVSRFTNGRGISVKLPFKNETKQRFPFNPIIRLLKKYEQEIEDINIFKGENQNELYISIKILNWSN